MKTEKINPLLTKSLKEVITYNFKKLHELTSDYGFILFPMLDINHKNGDHLAIEQSLKEQFKVLKTYIYNTDLISKLIKMIITGDMIYQSERFNLPSFNIVIFEDSDSLTPNFARSILSPISLQNELARIITSEILKQTEKYYKLEDVDAVYRAMKKDRTIYKIKRKVMRSVKHKLEMSQIDRVTLSNYENEFLSY